MAKLRMFGDQGAIQKVRLAKSSRMSLGFVVVLASFVHDSMSSTLKSMVMFVVL